MTIARRCLVLVISLLLTGAGSLLVGSSPASATVTTLCTGYTACAKAGMSDGGYAAASKTMWWRMYAGHNCTNYAAYRMVKSGLPNTRPWSGSGNATNWGTAMSTITNATPAVGAVAWWKAGVKPAGRVGHVAYVEKVVSADEIIVSQDSWGGDFSWARVTRASSGWPSGFVHFNDVPLQNTGAPAITGTPRAGEVLTASPGTWNPADVTVTYQWAQNGVDIAGATQATRKLEKAQVGKKMTVKVTASRLGHRSASAVSAATAAVTAARLAASVKPTVTGEPRVGHRLSADPGTWDPAPDELRYQWLADGVALPQATERSLELVPDLLGKRIAVQVSALKAGYPTARETSAASAPVEPGQQALAAPARLEGDVRPGSTLSLTLPDVAPDVAVAVQWLRNGTAVPGATGRSYALTAQDLGTRLVADLQLRRPGYEPLSARTEPTPVVKAQPRIIVSARPGVRGTRSLTFRAEVRAPGVPAVAGLLQVRRAGKVIGQVTVSDGVAAATLTDLPRGKRVLRFNLAPSQTLAAAVVTRRVFIR